MAEEFAAVAEQHLDDVYAYLVYLTGDRATADDLTAETFENALRSWKRFDPRRGSRRRRDRRGRARRLLRASAAGREHDRGEQGEPAHRGERSEDV